MFSASKSGQYQGYQISRSVRLRSSASAYLTRTPASASNRKTWTWSAWVKRGTLGASQYLFAAGTGGTDVTQNGLNFQADDTLRWTAPGTIYRVTTQVFRDPSAWYHIVLQFDTTQATANDRIRLYVNGVQITAFGTLNNPTQNLDYAVNQAAAHDIGRWTGTGSHFDGYLTEINFIDGQALTPASFGVTNAYGVWSPIKYNGTYGTNGFYLNFSDNSSNTATTIGKDSSGNGNNWTPNNISVTSGATYDSMIDVPTPWGDGGNGRGNYPVINPLDVAPTESSGRAQILDGNLRLVGANQFARGWLLPSTGQWYWEITLLDAYAGPPNIWGTHGVSSGLYGNVTGVQLWANVNGGIFQDGALVQTFQTWANNDVIGLAYNAATRSMSVYRNGTQLGTSVTANATDKYIYSYLNGTADTSSVAYNFGQRPFSYTPPSGFNALNTFNLPEPSIDDGRLYMAATTYTGNASTLVVTNTNNGFSFQPDFVWIKDRTTALNHRLLDAVRGTTSLLYSNLTDAQATIPNANDTFTSFNSNGFTLGVGQGMNANGDAYVAWQWNAGGSNATNTSGSITSTVRASTTSGFSVVTYTGTGANATVGHGLGVAPSMVIVKRRDSTGNWQVRHTSIAAANSIQLNLTSAAAAAATVWNSTAPTSTVFSIGTSTDVNANTGTYVAYCFASITGYSAFGSYTGNGSTDGPFVFCGFRPRWVMMKRIDTSGFDWIIQDTARDPNNPNDLPLYPDLASAEAPSNFIDMLSNGFKLRNLGGGWNASGGTYIFAAFAENPFKYALAR